MSGRVYKKGCVCYKRVKLGKTKIKLSEFQGNQMLEDFQ